jgi:hypothetical protein
VTVLEHRGSQTGYESIVGRFYASLYRFALSLTRNEVEVCDLRAHLRFVKNFAGLLFFFMEERAACCGR